MAVVGALRIAAELPPDEAQDAVIVVLLPDGGRGYLSKIFSGPLDGQYGFLRQDGTKTIGDVLRGKTGELPDLVHTHPGETIRDAVEILRTYSVSQMPVVNAEPPIMAGEVAGSVSERELLEAVFTGRAKLADRVAKHMARRCRWSVWGSRWTSPGTPWNTPTR